MFVDSSVDKPAVIEGWRVAATASDSSGHVNWEAMAS